MHQLPSNPNQMLRLVQQHHVDLNAQARTQRIRRTQPRQFHRSRR